MIKNFGKLAFFASLVSVLFFFCVNVSPVLGQTDTGSINGTITDPTGAVVPNAKVTVKSANTGLTRETNTNSSGIYTVPSLRPGPYTVAVTATGFQTVTQNVEVSVGGIVEVAIQLSVGKAVEFVEVTGAFEANEVNTESQTLSSVVTESQINTLPTSPTRNPYALVGTSGNVAEDTNSNRGAGFAINGMRSASTNILLDGAENVDTYTASIGQTVPLDSVQEFSVLTNDFTAEYGRASGGVVNVVTKSGTNAFHGSAYEYNRLSALSSNTEQNDSTGTKKGVFTRNDFGFAIGGPIVKDKLFFFNNTEWIRVRSNSSVDYTIIDPSSYSQLAPASQAFFTAYGKLVPGVQTIATGPCDAGVVSITCDAISISVPADSGGGSPQNTWMEVARVDYNLSSRSTLFVRYAAYHEIDFTGTVNASPYAGYNTGQNQFDQNYEVGYVHFFTNDLVNSAKVTYNRLNGPIQPLGTQPVSPTLYTSSTSTPAVTVGGFSNTLIYPGYSETTPGNAIPFGGPQNLYQFRDDLSWTHGKHQFKFGGQFVQLRDNRVFGAYENAVEGLGANLDSSMTNLVAGQILQYQGAIYPQGEYPCVKDALGNYIQTPACTLTLPVGPPAFNRNYRYNDGAAYAQDSWKVTSRLTVNLGLRWEYYGVQHNANPNLDSNFVMGSGANIFEQIRNGSVKLAKDGGVFWNPDDKNFGPRVGFAYDIFGDGKTAIRGGYGLSYERNFGNVTFNAIQNPPNYGVISLTSGTDIPGFLPVYVDNAGPLAGDNPPTKLFPATSQRAIDQNLKTAYAETWNLAVDHRVGMGVFSASYAGSHGVHLYDIANVNPGRYFDYWSGTYVCGGGVQYMGDGNCANRINYQYSNMNYRGGQGYSHYNALNVRYGVTDLGHKGLGLSANYTFSHSTDNLSSTFSDGTASNYSLGYADAFNPRLNYGNSDFDIRHRFNLSASWQLPWLKTAENKAVQAAFGGWSLGTIWSIRSGSPFSIYDCNQYNGTTCPLWVAGVPVSAVGSAHVAGSNLYNYITLPVDSGGYIAGQGDSLGIPICAGLYHVNCHYTLSGNPYPDRNQYWGPGYWNLDMNFYKTFKLTERFNMEFRGEFYNILNHHNQYISSLNLDVSSMSTPYVQSEKGGIYGYAGQPTDERRNIQFGLKLMF